MYFKVFKLRSWDKRSAISRRRFDQCYPWVSPISARLRKCALSQKLGCGTRFVVPQHF